MTLRPVKAIVVGATYAHWLVIREWSKDRYGRPVYMVKGKCGHERSMERSQLLLAEERQAKTCKWCPRDAVQRNP